jgi:hypothetical protein
MGREDILNRIEQAGFKFNYPFVASYITTLLVAQAAQYQEAGGWKNDKEVAVT